jgi:hypothetical protein
MTSLLGGFPRQGSSFVHKDFERQEQFKTRNQLA